MFYYMKILITFYGVFGVIQLIKAEITYDLPTNFMILRSELQPVLDKLTKFLQCSNKTTTSSDSYRFIFTKDRPISTCSPKRLLQNESFINYLESAIVKPNNILTLELEETNLPKSTEVVSTSTSILPPNEGQGTNFIDSTTTAPAAMSTTLDPLQEKIKKEKDERNNYIAIIITAVLVALLPAGIIGCAIAKYIVTLRQSGTYVVSNP